MDIIDRIKARYYDFRTMYITAKWISSVNKSKIHGLALMYHHVTDEDVDIIESCKHKIDNFKDTLLRLKADGYRFVSVDEALEIIHEKRTEKFVVVTFDDVPENVYHNAYPFLKDNNIPFILFITTNFINKEPYLKHEQIKEMDKDALCTIGAHTISHPMLRYSKDALSEMVDSKNFLERYLGHTVDFMAYPYGKPSSVTNKVMKLAKMAGYKCAFGTIETPMTDISVRNIFYLPRVVVK